MRLGVVVPVSQEYDNFAKFLDSTNNHSHCVSHLNALRALGMVRSVRNFRSTREIIELIGQGFPVKEWKSKVNGQDPLVRQLMMIVHRVEAPIDEDLFSLNISMITMFLPVYKEIETVSSWREAVSRGCLRTYFGKHDIFDIARGESSNYLFSYSDDYYDFVNENYSMSDRIVIYRSYLAMNLVKMKIGDCTYGDPRYFAENMESQMAEYEAILKCFSFDDKRLVFLGDGPGTGSILSKKNKWRSWSQEPNEIGHMAVRLGIVDSNQKIRSSDVTEKDVLVLLNVQEFLTDREIDEYCGLFREIISVNEDRKDRMELIEFKGSSRKVWFRGIEPVATMRFRPIATSAHYLKKFEPLCPQDLKSAIYCEEEGLKVADNGFLISYGEREGCLDIRTRHFPSKLEMSHLGEKKIVNDSKFKFEVSGQVVVSTEEVFKYYPECPGRIDVLRVGRYTVRGQYFITHIDNPRRVRWIESIPGEFVPVFYLFTKKSGMNSDHYFVISHVGLKTVDQEEKDKYVVRNGD